MGKALLCCQNNCFSKVIVESNFAELVDFNNSNRICSLELVWILEDIKLICEHFISIFFVSVNPAALALTSIAKQNKEAIVLLEKCPFFLFFIVKHDID